ncbi:hypothetical protein [Photobacterium galatheae]|uniref:Uncharacterized protein n=1 Tax=Photobacterium galatheae TaxID=1654360 RepID=A0A066S1L9_9GAMM|nr:hypothetical protein [Photobacterium galatheae]KDM93538.1 hypothetical protein EA58_00175 [Photobacterium galatheae]MCM0151362.1 hypothetical protein [Photobacterium galatheae]
MPAFDFQEKQRMDWFRRSVVMLLIVTLTGCSGPLRTGLWKEPYYDETISGFYLNPKEGVLLISGEKYSYIIQCESLLCDYAQASRQLEMKTSFWGLTLNPEGMVQGSVSFEPDVDLSRPIDPVLEKKYRDMRLLWIKHGSLVENRLDFSFAAKRYEVEGKLPFQVLETPLNIKIKTFDTNLEKVGKMVVTPVAIVLDGVYFVSLTSLFLLLIATGSNFSVR